MSLNRCPNYCGITCVNGSCPKALQEEYEECDCPVIKSCKDCGYYEGCVDCAFLDTEYCSWEGNEYMKKLKEKDLKKVYEKCKPGMLKKLGRVLSYDEFVSALVVASEKKMV